MGSCRSLIYVYAPGALPSVRHRKSSLASSVLQNVGHQPQVVFDENVPGGLISLGGQVYIMFFFLCRQGLGEAAGGQLQGIEPCAEHQPQGQHKHTPPGYSIAPGSSGFREMLP